MPDGPRYDDDFYAWTQYQAEVLRTMRRADNRLDRERLAEEIEDLGKSERNAVRSQIRRIIEHLLKLSCSPSEEPRYSWMRSIAEARATLRDEMSPALWRDGETMLASLYRDGRRQAALGLQEHGEHEAAASLPAACPYTLDQIVADEWYPERSAEPGRMPHERDA
jgi:hypothetical protein